MISNMKTARLLGWTSLAVGLTEIVATHWLEEEMGVENHETLIRAYGGREIAAGLEILRQPGISQSLANALWARVGGDALDIATLCGAATSTRNRNGLATIVLIVLAITGLDILFASRVQYDVAHGKAIAEAARQRVTPTNAIPTQVNAQTEVPVSIGNG